MDFQIDPQSAFDNDPMFRHALSIAHDALDQFDGVLLQLIERVRSLCRLGQEYSNVNATVLASFADLRQLYAKDVGVNDAEKLAPYLKATGSVEVVDSFLGSLAALSKELSSLNAQRTETIQLVQKRIIDPLLDFHQQLLSRSKTKRSYEEALDKFESTLSRYLGHSRRKDSHRFTEIAKEVVDAKLTAAEAGYQYVQHLNALNAGKEVFLTSRVSAYTAIFPVLDDNNACTTSWDAIKSFVKHHGPPETFEVKLHSLLAPPDFFDTDMRCLRQNLGLIRSTSPLKFASPAMTKRGFLWRKSTKGPLKSWQRRFCWIQMPEGLLMYLPKSTNFQIPAVMVDVCSSEILQTEVDERPFTFELAQASETSIFLQAENEGDMQEWMTALQTVTCGLPMLRSTASVARVPLRECASPVKDVTQQVKRMALYETKDTSNTLHDAALDLVASMELRERSSSLDKTALAETTFPLRTGYLALKEIRVPKVQSHDVKQLPRDTQTTLWQSSMFVLKSDGKLYQRKESRKLKQLIDLRHHIANRCCIQSVDDSLFQRKHVFSVNTLDGHHYYFGASNALDQMAWILALKRAANVEETVNRNGSRVVSTQRVHRRLTLRIIEARGLNPHSEPYCEIFMGNDRKARTNPKTKCNGEPFWREEFLFDDVAPVRNPITIAVMSHNRLQRDAELGRVCIQPVSIQVGEVEAWYPVVHGQGGDRAKMVVGDLKIRLKCEEDIVMAAEEYECLLECFGLPDCAVVYDLAQATNELEYIAQILLNIFDYQDLAIPWIKYLIDREVAQTDKMSILFRGNSILTKAMDCYMKICAMGYLESTIGQTISEIVENKVFCEVDPTRLDKGEDVKIHWRRLTSYANTLWQNIEASKHHVPIELRILFNHVQHAVNKKYNSEKTDKFMSVRYTSISGFLFLRLFCPAILNPKLFGLARDHPDPKTSRTLTLLAKTLQCLANLANFGIKEPFMVDMNVFIMDNSNKLMEFIDFISMIPSGGETSRPHCVEIDYQLMLLHKFIRDHGDFLQRRRAMDSENKENITQLDTLLLAFEQCEAKLKLLR